MIITEKHPNSILMEVRTFNNPALDIPVKIYEKIISFNTETKEAEVYGLLSFKEFHQGDKIKKTEIAKITTNNISSIIGGKFDIVTFKCTLLGADLYWKNTDIKIKTKEDLKIIPEEVKKIEL